MKAHNNFYLGLDIGTDSVGYAVTDEEYNLLKFHGEDAWGSHIFDEAKTKADRRAYRTARRRLDRRQQRVHLIQELFAREVEKVDSQFFVRLQESYLHREDCDDRFSLFNDADFTDVDYYKQYPTIHHLICNLMKSSEPHDVRLVYLACAWLAAHRGHFLNNIAKENIAEIKDFGVVYENLMSFFSNNGYRAPWENVNLEDFSDALRKKAGITAKNKELVQVLTNGKKPEKRIVGEEEDEDFPFSLEGIIKLLAGGTYSLKDLFGKEAYDELTTKSVNLGMEEEKLMGIMSEIGDDYDLIAALRSVYDWSVLADTLGGTDTISEAKVAVYNQHQKDLEFLKHILKTYKSKKDYDSVFRATDKDNYVAYVHHTDEPIALKTKSKEDFSKYLLSVIKDIVPADADAEQFEDMRSRLELRTFMPKQRNTDNRVIPHQLYWYELHRILNNARQYLPFLSETDETGLTVSEKIESVFLFRIPYFVGPLNAHSQYAWIQRKEGKITPWNFDQMVDLDASEEAFIQKLTNTCTYLTGEPVLPKDSLLYHKFMVLNEINNLKINGQRISVELKQRIYNEVFLQKKKVTRKYLVSWLIQNGFVEKGQEDSVGGIDEEIKSNLIPQISFKRLLDSRILTENDVERVIERASYAEDKTRLAHWLAKNYPTVSEEDRKYICSLKIKDFGRLSRKFLCEIEGIDYATGELTTIIGALWNTQNNLMEIIADADKYSFSEVLDTVRREYYAEHSLNLEDRLDEMYLSPSVKRSVYRTLDVVKDIKKAFGEPSKIFVEMARGGTEEQKGKRTKSRKEQILELYASCKEEDVRLLKQQLEAMGDYADSKLRGDKLFLYYMQLGKSMYSGKPIDLEKLGADKYCDIDHIYPQAYVKDDSVINNKVLVFSEENGTKDDVYPIADGIRHTMAGYWQYLKQAHLISDEKYKRLTRATPFTNEEKTGFINRQITETTQSTKAVATLLKEYFPHTEIVYSKARLASEFRQEFELYKSRVFNDLHHAADAYLNIVTGNVYNSKFTKNFYLDKPYSIKVKTVFTHPVICGDKTVWDGKEMLEKVKAVAVKNTAHFTKYAFFKKGQLFDLMPVAAAEGLTPLKKGMSTEKYGGYNKAGAMFYIPVKYRAGKKENLIIMSVELLYGKKFLESNEFAVEYAKTRLKHITGKTVDEVSFPMGMTPWKINTVLSLDGFRVCITGIANGGKTLLVQPMVQFAADALWRFYLKKLEKLVEGVSKNPRYVYSETYDKVSKEKNLELYDLYVDKLKNSIYRKRPNAPTDIFEKGRPIFEALDVVEQAKTLLNMHQVFGRAGAGGCDLIAIGGVGKAATSTLSSIVSNWAKNYQDVRKVDMSASGLWKKSSDNLLDLV